MKVNKKIPSPTRYFKAYLREVVNEATGNVESQVQCSFSAKPFSAEQFISRMMGELEAYAQTLLTNNEPEAVYENFNSAFGIFLSKLVPQDYIYEHSEEHKKFKEHVDNTLGQEADEKDTDANRLAAYMLCYDILTKEVGLEPASADLILNKRLGTLKVGDTADVKEET